MSILDKMEEESQLDIKVDDLTNISQLSRKLTQMEDQIEHLESELKIRKDELRKLSEDTLPNALLEQGLSEIKLTDGTTLSVTNYYSARITDETRDAAFKWLQENELGDIIKNTVSASFGREENDAAQELMAKLEEEGHDLVQKKWVEPMTLKATVKEQVEKGVALPLETFNVYIGQKIKVTK
tara:strand:+ start:125 stop:673 length:549 start_codon:yes stop_codon:yes gene_type:complete